MTRFKTLLLREWMQHQRGWIILVALPLLLFIGAALFGHTQVDLGDDAGDVPAPLAVTAGVVVGLAALTLVLAWGAALLQSPGLARRDTQDRSIEFWLSLPVGDAQSIGASLLVHLLIVPLAAFAIGIAGGLVLSLPVVAKVFGVGEWLALPWSGLLAALVAMALRIALGFVLATLWLSPLILGTMAASAWLKRWGVPVVTGVVGIGGLLLDKVYGNPIVWDTLRSLSTHARRSLIATESDTDPARWAIHHPDDVGAVLGALPRALWGDAGDALLLMASPAFLATLAVAAAAFMLLVLRRRRGA